MNEPSVPPAGHHGGQYLRGRTPDRRRNRPARTREEFLQQLPARLLIDRLSTPMLAIGLDGVVVYATAACDQLLGYRNGTGLTGQSLPDLLVGHSDTAPEHCITLLRAPKTIVKWQHTDGYAVSTVVSSTILLRATDPLMMVSLTDVTEWTWAGARARD